MITIIIKVIAAMVLLFAIVAAEIMVASGIAKMVNRLFSRTDAKDRER